MVKNDRVEGCGEVGETEEVNKGVGVGKNTEKVNKGVGVGVGKDTEKVNNGANLGEVVDKDKGKKEVKGVNEYEKLRNKNIEENEEKFQALGLRRHSVGTPVQKRHDSRKAFSNDKESDNYDPKNDSDQSSDCLLYTSPSPRDRG